MFTYSEVAGIESEIPKSSVLGLFLLLVFTNDLEKGIRSYVEFLEDPIVSASDLNHDLKTMKMNFNPDLTPTGKQTRFCFSCKLADHPIHLIDIQLCRSKRLNIYNLFSILN